MIPLKDINPTERTPYATIGLIVANVIVFFTEPLTAASTAAGQLYFLCKASIPWEITHWHQFPELVGACPNKSVLLSIVYSMFLHGSFLHIAGNMLYLWVFGNNIEDRLGPVRFIIFYFACGFTATFAQSYVSPNSLIPLIGASGAVAGVLGAYLVLFPTARVRTLVIFFFITIVEIRASVLLGFWLLLQVFSQAVGGVTGRQGGVAYLAHIGGFIAGMVLLFVFRPRRDPPVRPMGDWAA
jgi:rhomboid family protein